MITRTLTALVLTAALAMTSAVAAPAADCINLSGTWIKDRKPSNPEGETKYLHVLQNGCDPKVTLIHVAVTDRRKSESKTELLLDGEERLVDRYENHRGQWVQIYRGGSLKKNQLVYNEVSVQEATRKAFLFDDFTYEFRNGALVETKVFYFERDAQKKYTLTETYRRF